MKGNDNYLRFFVNKYKYNQYDILTDNVSSSNYFTIKNVFIEFDTKEVLEITNLFIISTKHFLNEDLLSKIQGIEYYYISGFLNNYLVSFKIKKENINRNLVVITKQNDIDAELMELMI